MHAFVASLNGAAGRTSFDASAAAGLTGNGLVGRPASHLRWYAVTMRRAVRDYFFLALPFLSFFLLFFAMVATPSLSAHARFGFA
ncbi:hypothetical protein BG844_22075 [Couchioplanes caeruleus subsp. caeruleus]|uniref:Uncharacterized protein n=1 Tax=Couchioplanes caeruleus subsp. caeruleus TaxID=56427 RepID=A0A1K0FHG5_9ACTN|nr:hypothetical protein BG844_22075 [Couchioplanes caeruleus subsp. caeruleus]